LALISQAGRETPYMNKSRCRNPRINSYTQEISILQVTYIGVLNIIYENNTEDYDTVVRNMDMSHRLSQYD